MPFDNKDPSEITPEQIQALVDLHERESERLDFKKDYELRDGEGKLRLLKAVAAFANHLGGYIVFGIEEDGNGVATAICGLSDAESLRRSVRDLIIQHIQPPLDSVALAVKNVGSQMVLIAKVDAPPKPWMITMDQCTLLVRRKMDRNDSMSYAEIRDAFLETARRETSAAGMVSPRAPIFIKTGHQRLDQTDPNQVFEQLERDFREQCPEHPALALTAVPANLDPRLLDARDPRWQDLLLKQPTTIRRKGWDLALRRELVTDLASIHSRLDDRHFLRLWANGCLEFWTYDLFWLGTSPKARAIWPYCLVERALNFCRLARAVYDEARYTGTTVFQAELINVKGVRLVPGEPGSWSYRFGSDIEPSPKAEVKTLRRNPTMPFDADIVAYDLLCDIYHEYGLEPEAIPFFDENRHSILRD